MSNEPLDVLFAHDRWATEQLLAACAPLDDARLDRPFPIGHGSLRATLVHLLRTLEAWDASINARPSEETAIDERSSIPALIADAERTYDRVQSTCRAGLPRKTSTSPAAPTA